MSLIAWSPACGGKARLSKGVDPPGVAPGRPVRRCAPRLVPKALVNVLIRLYSFISGYAATNGY